MKKYNDKIRLLLIFFIIFSASAVRLIKLDKVPSSLYYDEIDLGYQAKSFLTTGKDYRGFFNPFFFRSMNTDKAPLPIYFSLLPAILFKSPEYQVRGGAALAGIVCVILSMVLTYQLTGNKLVSAISGFVFAFSPWQIQFSRIAFEAIFMLMVFMASISLFLFWQTSRKAWAFYLSAILLGLNIYTYRIMSLFAPLTVLLLLIIYFKELIKEGILKVFIWLFIIGAITIPFLYATTIASADQPRIAQIAIFSNPELPISVQRHREVDSNDYIDARLGKRPVPTSFFFHNKILSYIHSFGENYYRNFSSNFLFLNGDPNRRHSPNDTGELLFIDIIGLAAGLVWVIKNIKDKKYLLLLALLFLSPIPSDLTMDGANHASRLIIFSGLLLITIALGYANIINWLVKNKKYQLGILPLVSLWLLAIVFYLHQYFVHYPIESARNFGYGYKQAIYKIVQTNDQYNSVRLTTANDPPMLYYLYWSNTPAYETQQYGTAFGDQVIKHKPLDLVKPYDWGQRLLCDTEEIKKLAPDTIYLITPNNLPLDFRSEDKDKVPTGIKLIDTIKYPDNEIAYYLVTRDAHNGISVLPDKVNSCKKQ